MINFIRTNSTHPDFKNLVKFLDQELAIRDGSNHAFYAQFNHIDVLKHCVVAYKNSEAIACGAFKPFDDKTVEIKRMYTLPEYRGNGLASQVLLNLENWAQELEFQRTILETGKKQPEALKLYTKQNYLVISNYGPYKNIENSVCFEKIITRHEKR